MAEVLTPGDPVFVRETRRVSDPARAQQLWDAVTAVRSQKQIPAIVRMSRYMNRFYTVNKGEDRSFLVAQMGLNLKCIMYLI